jgi:hypothetical protein
MLGDTMPDSESQATLKRDAYYSNNVYPNVPRGMLFGSFGFSRSNAETLGVFRYPPQKKKSSCLSTLPEHLN